MKNASTIQDKIIALRNVVPERGATEAEAMNALNLANALMQKYGVTEEDLRKVEFSRDMKKGTVERDNKHLDPAAQLCGVMIARFCEVKVWSSNGGVDGKHMNFFGLNQDVEMAEFLYGVIREAMQRGWTDYLFKGDYPRDVSRHKLYWSYRYGFKDRVNDKMCEMIEARASKATGTALVVLKMQLVEEAFSKSVRIKLRNGRSSKIELDTRSYLDGQLDGDRVNLNRPLRGGEAEGRLLG